MRDKGFWWCLGVYLFMYIADFVSTIINGDLVQYLEVNLLFRYGGFALFFLVSGLITFGFSYWYLHTDNVTVRFYIMWWMSFVIIMKVVVTIGNVLLYMNPPPLEVAMQVTQQERVSYAFNTYFLVNLLPYLITFLTYSFWSRDHLVEVFKK